VVLHGSQNKVDVRTKIVFACVLVSLFSSAMVGLFAWHASSNLLLETSERQLDALAEARAEDFGAIADAWGEAVGLIRSRTELREQLAIIGDERDRAVSTIRRILQDARESADIVSRIAVFDAAGTLVAFSGEAALPPDAGQPTDEDLTFSRFLRRRDDGYDARTLMPLKLGGDIVGTLEVVIDVREILQLAENTRGLGTTGETMLVAQLEPSTVTVLNDLRNSSQSPVELPLDALSQPVTAALAGESRVFRGVDDYRGVPVWAATRYLPRSKTGIVVKIDEGEALEPVLALRRQFVDVALSVGALAILAGALLGLLLSKKIRALDAVVKRVRNGETALRADTAGEDELSFLAESFNELLDKTYANDAEPRDRR